MKTAFALLWVLAVVGTFCYTFAAAIAEISWKFHMDLVSILWTIPVGITMAATVAAFAAVLVGIILSGGLS